MQRNITYYAKDFTPLTLCGKNLGYVMNVNGAFELPFEIEPTKGEHDYTTCKGCQNKLKTITKKISEDFEGKAQKKPFPYCCTYHSNLTKLKNFDRAAYANVPEMLAKKVVFTHQHIINKHGSENWYKEITDYIDWAVESFGQMPNDYGEPLYLSSYFSYVTQTIEQNEELSPEKKKHLLEFVKAYQTPRTNNSKTDFNVLLNTYENWLKAFPFELKSYFGNLKQHFEKQLPIFKGKPEVNIYSHSNKVTAHTKGSLFEALINLTNKLLTQISGVALYEQGLITDVNKIKLELVINARKLKLQQGYNNGSQNEETRYRKMIKAWFKDEKEFMNEITPLLKAAPPQQAEKKNEPKTLSDFFADTEKYNAIMKLLVDKSYCQPETFIWKDEKNGNKSFLAALLKYLHKQNYYVGNKQLSNEQIKAIAKNTFGWRVSIDTIKKANPDNFDFKFIPAAFELS